MICAQTAKPAQPLNTCVTGKAIRKHCLSCGTGAWAVELDSVEFL